MESLMHTEPQPILDNTVIVATFIRTFLSSCTLKSAKSRYWSYVSHVPMTSCSLTWGARFLAFQLLLMCSRRTEKSLNTSLLLYFTAQIASHMRQGEVFLRTTLKIQNLVDRWVCLVMQRAAEAFDGYAEQSPAEAVDHFLCRCYGRL